MRLRMCAMVAATALALGMTPAAAAWRGYFTKAGIEISFNAPVEPKGQKDTYNSAMAGKRNSVVIKAVDDNVEFKVTLVDFTGRANDEAALIKEAAAVHPAGSKMLLDTEARVEGSYGRKVAFDLPNNSGRSTMAIFFKDNHLIKLQATVLPGGDMQSPDMGRFVDSLAFYKIDDAAEVKTAN